MKRIFGQRVVAKMPKRPDRLQGSGLYIPECANEPPVEAVVLGVGGDVVEDIRIGDRVMFDQWAGLEHEDEVWGRVLIVEEKDLIAVIEVDREGGSCRSTIH